MTSPEDEMLRNRKRQRHGKEQTEDNFVESVEEIRVTQTKPHSASKAEKKVEENPQQVSGLMSGVQKCDMGMSPEVLTRELAKE